MPSYAARVRVSYASEQGQGAANEDRAVAGRDWAFVLDGATAPAGVDTGCHHDVGWLVDRLASTFATELSAERHRPLPDCLAAAIHTVRGAHGAGCDLDNPDSPSATVAAVRAKGHGGGLEYLVLADSFVLLPGAVGDVTAVTDDRLDHLPGGRPYTTDLVRASRNTSGGFWVAAAAPEAAHRAVTGTATPAGNRFALLTDGCSRLVEYYDHTWEAVLERAETAGPAALVTWVRDEECHNGVPHGKRHDDATALVGTFDVG